MIRGATALVTGGASGIGLLTAERLLAAGASRLVIRDIQDMAMHAAADALRAGFRVDVHPVDLADPAQLEAGVRALRDSGTEIDILVNNAGVIVGGSFVEHSPADISRTMDVNVLPFGGVGPSGRGHYHGFDGFATFSKKPGVMVQSR